jgi:hypothetical protein
MEGVAKKRCPPKVKAASHAKWDIPSGDFGMFRNHQTDKTGQKSKCALKKIAVANLPRAGPVGDEVIKSV